MASRKDQKEAAKAQRLALEQARDTGLPAATPPIRLVQEPGSQLGFLVLLPIYARPAASLEERRASLRGFAVAVYRIGDLVDTALRSAVTRGLGVTVTDAEKRLVPDLVLEDFEILDNAKVQTINVFENKPTPITTTVMIDTSGSMTASLDLVKDGQNHRAAYMLARAEADAELAVALARANGAQADAAKATESVNELKEKATP